MSDVASLSSEGDASIDVDTRFQLEPENVGDVLATVGGGILEVCVFFVFKVLVHMLRSFCF